MAAAFVAERGKGVTASGTAPTISVTGITAGNHLIILLGIPVPGTGTNSITSVTDDVGNTYTIDLLVTATATGSASGMALVSGYCASAPSTLTINQASGATTSYKIEEFSGLATSNWFDTGNHGAGTTTTGQTSPSATPAAAGELAVGVFTVSRAETTFTSGNIGGIASTQAGTPRNASVDLGFEYVLSCASGLQTSAGTWASAPITIASCSDCIAFYKLPAVLTDQPFVHMAPYVSY